MNITTSAYYEYYENGQLSYELIETFEDGVVVETIENSYDENGNLIVDTPPVEEPIEEPVVEDLL